MLGSEKVYVRLGRQVGRQTASFSAKTGKRVTAMPVSSSFSRCPVLLLFVQRGREHCYTFPAAGQ